MDNQKKKHPLLCTAAVLGSMAIYNYSEYRKATFKNINRKEEYRFYTGRFGNIAYKRIGHGKPILLIHEPTPASNLNEWNNIMNELSKNYSVYALDLLGCGYSDKSNMEYSVYVYALAINDFVKNRICRGEDARKVTAISYGISAPLLISAAALSASLYEHIGLINPQIVYPESRCPMSNSHTARLVRYIYNLPIIGSFIFNIIYGYRNILRKISSNNTLCENERRQLADSMYESAHIGGFNSRFLHSSISGNLMSIDSLRMIKKVSVDCFIISEKDSDYYEPTISALLNEKDDIRTIKAENICPSHSEYAKNTADTIISAIENC